MKKTEKKAKSSTPLSKEEMRKIVAGSGDDCQDYLASCSTPQRLNCCNGLICADNKCYKKT